MQRLTTTHVRRWHTHGQSEGRGHLYQGVFKSFPVQDDRHFLRQCSMWRHPSQPSTSNKSRTRALKPGRRPGALKVSPLASWLKWSAAPGSS
jgi:hypothetical protein